MERTHLPGAAWGIVIDGELAHVGVAGQRDLAAKAPVTRDSIFRIASMTKSFTAMAIMKLRDDGKLSLDDLAERYVPELKGLTYPTSDSPRITVRHLLSHAEGFPEDNPWGDQQLAATEAQFSEMLRKGIPFSNPPGVAYEYSNYGFAILGRIVTKVSGRPYREYIADAILRPLGMKSTTLEPTAVPRDRIAHGYRWEDNTVEGRTAAGRRCLRRHGGHADFARRSRTVRWRLSRCVASSRRTRDRPGQPRIVTGNAADLAIATGDGGAHIRRDAAAECGRLRLWPPGCSNL